MKPDSCSTYVPHQPECNSSNSSYGNSRVRVIRLRRHNNVPLGFSVRGGLEHGTGIFVSEVRPGSEAHRQGLLLGDQILRINGFNIEYAIHDEVLALLRAKPGVVVKVKSMGMIPVKDSKKDPLTWKIIDQGLTTPEIIESKLVSSCSPAVNAYTEIKVSIPSIGSTGLGCSIVKGPPEFPGIYIQSVKIGSLAEQAGLQVGDRIMEMNGRNFNKLDFADAVAVLKSSKQMSLVLCKGLGVDLFPEEKASTEVPDTVKISENKRLPQVPEEEIRQERRTKKTNEQTSRAKNGSNKKHPNVFGEQGIKLNERSSCLEMDTVAKDIKRDMNFKAQTSRSIKVCASIHSPSSDEVDSNCLERCARESGDGMDFDSINRRESLAITSCSSWEAEDTAQKNVSEDNQDITSSRYSECLEKPPLCRGSMELNSERLQALSSHILSGSKNNFHAGMSKQSSTASDETSEHSSLSSDDYLGVSRLTSNLDCPKPPNEFLKRKQHELLMEEFREVHKKMFAHGQQQTQKQTEHTKNNIQDRFKHRQQVRKDKTTPPPPDITLTERVADVLEQLDSDEDPCTDTSRVGYKRRQREPPAFGGHCPEGEILQNMHEKLECGTKPLVTIGPYPNTFQQNRFLMSEKNKKNHPLSYKEKISCKDSKEMLVSIQEKNMINSSSASSTGPSSTSSEPRSPTSESVTSSDSFFHQSSSQTVKDLNDSIAIQQLQNVPNNFQTTLSQFSKHLEESLGIGKADKKEVLQNSSNGKLSRKNNNLNEKDSERAIIIEEDLKGKEVKKIILKKNGPLNFRIEGGINSDPSGKIHVSELWDGSCTTSGGRIELGDQILKVDNTKITGLSLTAANVALRNANSNTNKEMTLTIARLVR